MILDLLLYTSAWAFAAVLAAAALVTAALRGAVRLVRAVSRRRRLPVSDEQLLDTAYSVGVVKVGGSR